MTARVPCGDPVFFQSSWIYRVCEEQNVDAQIAQSRLEPYLIIGESYDDLIVMVGSQTFLSCPGFPHGGCAGDEAYWGSPSSFCSMGAGFR
jgi:hypothetical protein